MAVKAEKHGNTIRFYPETSADSALADWLCKLTNEAKALVASADPGTVAKSGLTGVALIRQSQQEKIRVLRQQADAWTEKGRDWSLQGDLRAVYQDKARKAYAEAEALQSALDGR